MANKCISRMQWDPSTSFTGAALAIKPWLINAHLQLVPREGVPTHPVSQPGLGVPDHRLSFTTDVVPSRAKVLPGQHIPRVQTRR